MRDHLLSLRLVLRPASPAELTAAAAILGYPADPIPDDLAPGWLMERKRDGQLAGIVSAQTQLTCIVESAHRRRGYASEALARLALGEEMPHRLPRPPTAAARGLLERIGYRPDRDPQMMIGSALAAKSEARQRQWSAAYRQRAREYHRRLGIPAEYARRHALKLVAEAQKLRSIGRDATGREQYLAPPAGSAWKRMQRAASAESVILNPVSAYRGIDYQAGLLERKLAAGATIEDVLRVSAAPGYSEHHSGLALDLGTSESPPLEEAFENTPAFAWLTRHAAEFGFFLSYPRDNPHGIAYEPWHWAWRT